MKFGVEPIGNVPVYKRIGINETPAGDPSISTATALEMMQQTVWKVDAARIWEAVVQASEGNG